MPAISIFAHEPSPFLLKLDGGHVVSLRYADDRFPTEYVLPGSRLGVLHITYRTAGGPWRHLDTSDGSDEEEKGFLDVTSKFEFDGPKLVWRFGLRNISSSAIEIGDLATPLPMNGRYNKQNGMISSVLKHSFISGDGSFIFWMRPNSVGPYLMMTPLPGTTPEYWDAPNRQYQVYILSKAAGEIAASKGTKWRIPETSIELAPGASASYGYVFQWAKDYEDVRDTLVRNGQVDVQVVPGMTVPTDLDCEIALRTRQAIQGVDAEFPPFTTVQRIGSHGDSSIFRLHFSKLGENRLTVRYGDGRTTYLEFFATEPLETLIKKRAAFLARCQHRDPNKWYNGLISEWNMESDTLLGPDNYDRITGWRIYEVSCDDPGLGKPAFLAAKNAEFPVQSEVDALDDYISHFVWGGLQETTSEKYPYAIYGIPDWKTLRESKKKPHDGVEHVWRVYDYPHVIVLYSSMYRIASHHPEIHTQLKPMEYLERAYGTACAMFTVPAKVDGWSAYRTGFYNEVAMLDVISDLQENHLNKEAATLKKYWEDKVRYFVLDNPDLFGSEYAFDSTGFESTQALADYALAHGQELRIPSDAARQFMDRQIACNIFCRGSIEPAYYYLGSDYRGSAGNSYTLSYMSQMGGSSVLDYGLHYASDPAGYLRLGYASYLSSWALMNTGTSDSNYGYWYPGKANDGAAGGGFEPAPYGVTWLGQPHHRGAWYYACEIDLGYCGALRTAATIVADDPIFGRICLGGIGRNVGAAYKLIPRDGLRKRLFIRTKSVRADILLDGSRFAKEQEVTLRETPFSVVMPIVSDSRLGSQVTLSNLPSGDYRVRVNGRIIARFRGTNATVDLRHLSEVGTLMIASAS